MEDFVTFEIAKKLKEKGLREKCFYCYRNRDGKSYANHLYDNDCETYITSNELLYSHNSNVSSRIDAPTISQVLKWLREEKKLYIMISPTDTIAKIEWSYDAGNISTYRLDWIDGNYGYNSYEEAALAGIEYILDNLI